MRDFWGFVLYVPVAIVVSVPMLPVCLSAYVVFWFLCLVFLIGEWSVDCLREYESWCMGAQTFSVWDSWKLRKAMFWRRCGSVL